LSLFKLFIFYYAKEAAMEYMYIECRHTK